MDRSEEDMKSVGFFGIFKQSFKTIFSWKKIFAQITLTLILPLTIVFLAEMEISHHVFWNIETNSFLQFEPNEDDGNRTSAMDWLYYLLFKITFLILLTVFSLLSTAAVVFTIASIYTDRETLFRNAMKVVQKVWKRLLVTFSFIYIALFIYDVIGSVALAIFRSFLRNKSTLGLILLLIFLIVYIIVFLYLSVVCQLASVVTVLENTQGFKAMKKGKYLANGKKKVGMGIAFVLYAFLVGLFVVYELFVEYGRGVFELAMIWRVMIGILCGLLLLMLFLLFIVTQTVLYLVCKSHHGEVIDKLSLSTVLGGHMGETVVNPTVGGEEIQLGRPQLQQQSHSTTSYCPTPPAAVTILVDQAQPSTHPPLLLFLFLVNHHWTGNKEAAELLCNHHSTPLLWWAVPTITGATCFSSVHPLCRSLLKHLVC
ncbi:unnamed protein product [Lactuca virosa]|uniref:Uncharacterized protein n=1 Tax=Lactuca virosa TaxID=75947 RepID=A0AAU9PV66_9ASTR|nr:unnamed protein product [Lactuca virosa]